MVAALVSAIRLGLQESADRESSSRKAIGWALRDHARIDPGWVRALVTAREDVLSGLTKREALKHVG